MLQGKRKQGLKKMVEAKFKEMYIYDFLPNEEFVLKTMRNQGKILKVYNLGGKMVK